jgi:hypothetical protein
MRPGPRILGLALAALLLAGALPLHSADGPEILPLSQVKPGMKGIIRTIFAGDQIEEIELEVIGVMPNLMGPKQDVILVVLKGAKAEFTGVVAGMSGSPVYIDGKLAGALSLRFGLFTKEPLAGVTPIEKILEVQKEPERIERAESGEIPRQYPVPTEFARQVVTGAVDANAAYMAQIDTPLLFSGFRGEALQQFAGELARFGMVAAQGGTAEPQPDDADLKPGDMVGMVLMHGDLSLQAGCTVTAIVGDRVFVCGHPFLSQGRVAYPMARGRVLTTMASSMASVKLMNAGGLIGSFTQDRTTAVMGRLGATPRMIPIELHFVSPGQEKNFRFEIIEHAKLTPLLVAIATFNGLVANTAYSEGTTFQLTGSIAIRGQQAVALENMFAPTDAFIPDGIFVATSLQQTFSRLFTNPYEEAEIEKISLRVESIPARRSATIESAWASKSEVRPGEEIIVKVLLRPYRGAPFIREMPVTIPMQAPAGNLRLLVSDADTLNRTLNPFSRSFGGFGIIGMSGPTQRLASLSQLISLLNRERRNHRLYLTLLQPSPTLLFEDKELPNAPVSQINVLDQRRTPGTSMLLRESAAGEWSLPMNQVITGQHVLTLTVK